MRDAITARPTPADGIRRGDCVADWLDLARRSPEDLPAPVHKRLVDVIGVVNLGLQAVVILTVVGLVLWLATGFAAFFTASLLTPGTFLVAIPINVGVQRSRRFCGRMAISRPYRRFCAWGLRSLADKEVRAGRSSGGSPDHLPPAPASTAILTREERVCDRTSGLTIQPRPADGDR